MDDDASMVRHRATLGLAPDARATPSEVKAAFQRAVREAHPDARGARACAKTFREIVDAREALLRRGTRVGARAFRGGGVGARGGGQTRAFAAVLATPFVVAATVSMVLPKSNESGANGEIGRVHGWMNAPVNAWLKEDRREPGDGNRERFWKTGRVNAK